MNTRSFTTISLLAVLTGTATSNNCGVGLGTCFYCGDPITAAVGTPSLLCGGDPGGLGELKDCVGWRIPSGLCFGIEGQNCDDDYICCPFGWTGYFFCNEWIVVNGEGVCTVESRCSRGCCSESVGQYLYQYDCDGDGTFETIARGYTCTVFIGP
jgi:hypothetical protein